MRKVTVPVDMASEQKSLLGIISKRQLIYLISGGLIIYTMVPPLWHTLGGINITIFIIALVICAFPVAAAVTVLGFIRREKYHMYFDRYLITKYGQRTQVGVWRKGKNSKRWMEEI